MGTGLDDVAFRDGQEEAIRHVVDGDGRLLVVQKTGWGKSFVYFIATKMLREEGIGPTLLVSPLLALMRNQQDAASRMDLQAETINSANQDEWDRVFEAVYANEVDILLISPERLANEKFREEVLSPKLQQIALLVIDEAHCISDWGHDFRPHYRLIERVVRNMPPKARLLATTATANNRVMEDLEEVLGPDLTVSRGDLNRPSLTLQTIQMPSHAHRLAWLAEQLGALPGHGIIYVLTIRDAEQVAAWLRHKGFNVDAYHGAVGHEERPRLEDALLSNRVKALVATSALGMGFDKPDLDFVIHYQAPASVVSYYQQVGRAGRAVPTARGVLLSGTEDREINDYFIDSAFPSHNDVESVIDALEGAPEGLSIPQLSQRMNIRYGRLTKAIQLLSLESPAPIAKQDTKWQLTAAPLSDEFWERAERLTALRREEQAQMDDYIALDSDHMKFLIEALDGDPMPERYAGLPPLPEEVEQERVAEAMGFLRQRTLPIEPRGKWPSPDGMPKFDVKGNIPAELRASEGRALSTWGDPGWSSQVQRGKYESGKFSDDLVEACRALIEAWAPTPAPAWVTYVPSLRHPDLVPDFARRLANAVGLPFAPAVVQTRSRPEQKLMQNSAQQARNLDGTLEVSENLTGKGPVLLIDDMVDSRWTFTVCAWLLRSHGCADVWTLALATTSPSS